MGINKDKNIPLLMLLIFFISFQSWAQNRSPAVEEFIGIDYVESHKDELKKTPLFNLERDISLIHKETTGTRGQMSSTINSHHSAHTENFFERNISIVATFFLSLPILVWLTFIMKLKLRSRLEKNEQLTVLNEYRNQKENRENSKDHFDQAS